MRLPIARVLSQFGFAIVALIATAAAPSQADTLVDVVVGEDSLSTLESLVVSAGLVGTLSSAGPFTVFAPTDAAFAELAGGAPDLVNALATEPGWVTHLTNVLLFHVVPGMKIESGDIPSGSTTLTTANGEDITVMNDGMITVGPAVVGGPAEVIRADVPATNGVAHVVDAVLTPSFVTTNIVDVALSLDPEFSTLVTFVDMAGLVTFLSEEFGLTVFAPTNAAFAKLDPELVKYLTSAEGAADLFNVLAYHVLETVVPSVAIAPKSKASVPTALPHQEVKVFGATSKKGIRVNRSNVVIPDVLANNGIIHAIDTVLIPPYLRKKSSSSMSMSKSKLRKMMMMSSMSKKKGSKKKSSKSSY